MAVLVQRMKSRLAGHPASLVICGWWLFGLPMELAVLFRGSL
jgi:hypothetical protein